MEDWTVTMRNLWERYRDPVRHRKGERGYRFAVCIDIYRALQKLGWRALQMLGGWIIELWFPRSIVLARLE